ncbi:MAG: hypothetical protein HZB59_07425 [Ignavibacteriales bacterium]|nr:hypothetical protein [Ignavibacteriales bacterium]
MPTRDYLPRSDSQFVVWLENFAAKLETHALTLGFEDAVFTQAQNDLTALRAKLADVQTKKTSVASSVEAKEATLADVKKHVRDTVIITKRKSSYTQAIGEDLGIVAAEGIDVPTDLSTPEFQTTILPDKVRLDWTKGYSDGIVVQSKRGTETEYTTIGKDTRSPYDDERACLSPGVPEVRMYRIRYLVGDDEVGNWSNESRVVFAK